MGASSSRFIEATYAQEAEADRLCSEWGKCEVWMAHGKLGDVMHVRCEGGCYTFDQYGRDVTEEAHLICA
jgi:hypothetical protein